MPIVSQRRSAAAMAVFVPDPVGRRHDHRLAVPGRDRDRAAEPAEAAEHLGPPRRLDRLAHQLDRALPGLDVDAGRACRRAASGHADGRSATRRHRLLEHELAARDVVRDGLRVAPSKQAKQNWSYGRSRAASTPRIER